MAALTRLRVAFVPGVTPDKWARVWRERHPRMPLDLVPVEEASQRTVLDDGGADMVLARLPEDRSELVGDDLHCVVLYDELPVVVAAHDHLVAAAEDVRCADLVDEQLLRPHRSGWRPEVPQLDFPEMTDAHAVEAAAAGSGIVVLPMSVARLHHRRDVIHRVMTDLGPTQVALVWKREEDSDVHQDFVGITKGRRPSSSR